MLKKDINIKGMIFKKTGRFTPGEPIENKIRRIVNDKEPITDTMPKEVQKEGEYNTATDIRRDKWLEAELAQSQGLFKGVEQVFKIDSIGNIKMPDEDTGKKQNHMLEEPQASGTNR